MPDLISGYDFIRAVLIRLHAGFVFAGLACAAYAVQAEDSLFSPRLDLLAVQSTQTGTGWLPPYRLSAGIMLTNPANAAPAGLTGNSASQLFTAAKPEKEAFWTTNSRWQTISGSDRASLAPLLRVESQEERIEIIPRRNSVWMVWRKAFH